MNLIQPCAFVTYVFSDDIISLSDVFGVVAFDVKLINWIIIAFNELIVICLVDWLLIRSMTRTIQYAFGSLTL